MDKEGDVSNDRNFSRLQGGIVDLTRFQKSKRVSRLTTPGGQIPSGEVFMERISLIKHLIDSRTRYEDVKTLEQEFGSRAILGFQNYIVRWMELYQDNDALCIAPLKATADDFQSLLSRQWFQYMVTQEWIKDIGVEEWITSTIKQAWFPPLIEMLKNHPDFSCVFDVSEDCIKFSSSLPREEREQLIEYALEIFDATPVHYYPM